MRSFLVSLLVIVGISLIGLTAQSETAPDTSIQQAQARAEQHLSLLRDEKWDEAANLVAVKTAVNNATTFIPLDTPSKLNNANLKKKMIGNLKRLYGQIKPGAIQKNSGKFTNTTNNQEPKAIMFSYKHGDLDGLEMLPVDGKWYRVWEVDSLP